MAVEETDLVQVAVRIDKLVDRIDSLLDHHGSPHTQTVIHRTAGMGPWGAAAVTACFLTYLSLVILAIWASFQVNNLWAWKDVHAAKIAVLESKFIHQSELKEKVPSLP